MKEDRGFSWKAFFPWTEEGKKMREERKEQSSDDEDESFEFEPFLRRAGFSDLEEKKVKKTLFVTTTVIALVAALIIIGIAATGPENTWQDLLVFMTGYWTVVFVFLLIIVAFSFTLYLDIKAYQRTKEVDEHLPDYLQLAASNISAGMPIDQALWFAVRPNFGVLAEEIEKVAKQTYAGKDLDTALRDFAERFDSDDLDRAVALILEGMEAGGEMAELLSRIALNIEETNILRKEMSANVTTYVIFIAMATLLGAPFLFGLSTQLLIMIKEIAAGLEMGGGGAGMFSMSLNPDAVATSDFKWYARGMLVVSSFFSGAIISVIRHGNVKEGVTVIPGMALATLVLYQLANWGLSLVMGGFL
jgi:Flp pilus assembly protein TadB